MEGVNQCQYILIHFHEMHLVIQFKRAFYSSWLLVSSLKAEKDLSTPDRWRLKRKTQELCGVPARLGLGTPKCIDFATCFGLSRSVFKHQLNEKHANLTKSKHRKVKVENYWLQLVPLAALLRPPPLSWSLVEFGFAVHDKVGLTGCYSHCLIYLPFKATLETSNYFH